jgi:uncharacterized protein Yka (UPF0111/DUF47 family)
MFQPFEITQLIVSLPLAQVATSNEQSTLMFLSGPQFFIALIAGVVMAFAFQFLLSNLSIAAGISAGINPTDTDTDDDQGSWGKKIRKIEAKVGSATVLIVNTALFAACFLAVKLTLIHQAGLGAIVAVVIWSVYFLLLLWLSSQAIASLLGTVGNTASAGVQGVMATVATALSGQAASSQITNTVQASVDAVSKELRSTLSSNQLRENLENYVSTLQLPQPNLKTSPNQALSLLGGSGLLSGASSELVDLIQSASSEDLTSGKLRDRLTQILGLKPAENGNGHQSNESSSEQQSHGNEQPQTQQGVGLRERTLELGMSALVTMLTGRGGVSGLSSEALKKSLSSLTQQVGNQAQQVAAQVTQSAPSLVIRSDVEHYLLHSPTWYLQPDSLDRGFREVLFDPEADAKLVHQQLTQLNRPYFVEVLNRREELNPEQINSIADGLELIRREVLDQVQLVEEQERSQALRHQVETYLSSAPKEALNSDQIQQDFTALLADPDATYEMLGNRLIQFDRDTLTQLLLASRQDLNPDETEQILNDLEGARDRFLNQSQETWNQLQTQASEFRQQVESYLRETNSAELSPESIQQTFQVLLESPGGGLLALRTGLRQLDRNSLEQILSQRQDLNPQQVNQLIDQVETIRDGILHAPQALTEQARKQVDHITHQLADYLRGVSQNAGLGELDPEQLQHQLQQLLDDPQAGISALRTWLSHFDRETLVRLLSQQQGVSEEQINRRIDQVLNGVRAIARSPRELVNRARDRVQNVSRDVSDSTRNYLNSLEQPELNYDGIQRDIRKLFDDPEAGLEALRDRLSQFDRDTLVALLSSRPDISEEQANKIVDQIEAARDSVLDRAEQVQTKVQERINALKHQAKEQAEEVQKTTAAAAWWVFGTAITSVATAAIAGVIASSGLHLID